MAYHYILSEHREGVAYLTINRPNQLNALNKATIEELNQAINQSRYGYISQMYPSNRFRHEGFRGGCRYQRICSF